MKAVKSIKKKTIIGATLALGIIIPQATPQITYAAVMEQDIVDLRIIETTDIHANVMNYDYYSNGVTQAYGLSKAATVIESVRSEVKNSLLLDNGDTIQGSAMGDYVQNNDLVAPGYVHPSMRAMNLLGYDAATVGNHEFNYGLDFLDETINDAKFPYVNANVYNKETNDNYFTPFEIIEREVEDADGEKHTIKVGITGFVPPQILNWDAKHLDGKLEVRDIVDSAKEVIPQMKSAGADVVVVLAHSGIADYDESKNLKAYEKGMENAAYYLSEVDGIDAILTGHQHKKFPNAEKPDFADGNGIDNTKGTINGVPTIMPGSWGNNIGLIDLKIEKVNDAWVVKDSSSELRSAAAVESDAEIEAAVKEEHAATLEYMKSPVGELKGDLNTFFALVQDNASMEIVNRAQTWYLENALKGTEYEGLPVLSAAAPFKAGRGNPDNYTNVQAGMLTIRNIADLYQYDNNVLHAIKLNGSEIKEWLEWSAGQFNQIDTSKKEAQSIVNSDFPTYNFDVIDGVTYEIDLTEAAKYDKGGKVIHEDANRIKKLSYNGKPVTEKMEFVVASNDYRSGTAFFNPGMAKTILKAPDSNRQIVADYVKENKSVDAAVNNNWSFKSINSPVTLTFPSNVKAEELAKETKNITYTGKVDDQGFGVFQIDLSKKGFSDVKEGFWAKDYIDALTEKGIIFGETDTIFNPEGKLTRAQFAALIVRTMGLSDGTLGLGKEIELAYENGITTLAPNKFEGNRKITREQMAAMAVRAYEKKTGKKVTASPASYKDSKNINDGLVREVNAAKELGFMIGYGNGTFLPKNSASRAEGARVVYEFLNK